MCNCFISLVRKLSSFKYEMVLIHFCFQEYNIAKKESEREAQKANLSKSILPKVDYVALICVLVSFFVILSIFVLVETLTVPMVIDLYAWSPDFAVKVAGIGLSIGGIIAAIMFGMSGVLAKKFSDRFVFLFFGLVPLIMGVIVHIPMGNTLPKIKNCTNNDAHLQYFTTPTPLNLNVELSPLLNKEIWLNSSSVNEIGSLSRHKRHASFSNDDIECLGCPAEQKWCFDTPIVEMPQMVVADVLLIMGYAVSFAFASGIFSKLLGPKPQGTWMGVLTSCGSLSRMTGPIFVTYMYTAFGPRWTFITIFLVLLCVIVCVSLIYKRLVPLSPIQNDETKPLKY